MALNFDIVVIGAGMAGASIASALAQTKRVALIEMEAAPGYHTTGRSAALYTELYGNSTVCEITSRGRAFFENPPRGFLRPLLHRRGCLYSVRPDQMSAADHLVANACQREIELQTLSPDRMAELIPALRSDVLAFGLFEPQSMDIDVDGLHQGYLRCAKERGVAFFVGKRPVIEQTGNSWLVTVGDEEISCAVVVNAGGAWADSLAAECGADPRRLIPHRRTVALVDPPVGRNPQDISGWPAVIDIDEKFYFKPESGKLLCSPADEHPSDPCDAVPEEIDIAIAIDRMQGLLDFPVRRIESSWAGLRTFTADKTPVVGFDPQVEGFFWFAGQGGYGIQMAPALSDLGARMLLGDPLDEADRRLARAVKPCRPALRAAA
ncbi:FAD-dependent catabolic D-arginine dehydrogenase DauA [Alteripontixanthobacter maritimus]|uniref:FAD-dependent catabolic D-arginine dehydrogenase DauA n=1 Tax=Alteripontixanthobacter maritimus TaxID=2161824 RepID=A0A369Q7L3_9SPHN|nr:FAD-binding oxidoreductase [Alteripontixanthobacter maritimus]RDC60863.1 FAD-dependent catabolic D-arginine dehydrogenase DauA [Alteripontixanthobacter maritimus]